METERRLLVARGRVWGNGEMLDERDTLSFIRLISSGDLTYSLVTVINNTVLYSCNLLKGYILNVLITHTQKGIM